MLKNILFGFLASFSLIGCATSTTTVLDRVSQSNVDSSCENLITDYLDLDKLKISIQTNKVSDQEKFLRLFFGVPGFDSGKTTPELVGEIENKKVQLNAAMVAKKCNMPAQTQSTSALLPANKLPEKNISDASLVKATPNPLDLHKNTSSNEVWISFHPSVTVQERQFCRIVDNFRVKNELAKQSGNQIKVNESFKEFNQSLNALLPDGKFQGWVMRGVYIAQASDGSAEVLLELPCGVYVGSNACDADPKKFYGTAPEGSRIYSELAKMNKGDFVLTSGTFVFTDKSVFDKGRSVASFSMIKTASHCRAKEMPIDSDFFGVKLEVISTIK